MKTFKEYLKEHDVHNHIDDFVNYACGHLGLENPPKIELINDKKHAQDNASFGGYHPGEKFIRVNIAGRHPADVLRTLGHELVHHKQDLDGKLHDGAGETGSDCENEANSEAGVLLRNYGRANPHLYESILMEMRSKYAK